MTAEVESLSRKGLIGKHSIRRPFDHFVAQRVDFSKGVASSIDFSKGGT